MLHFCPCNLSTRSFYFLPQTFNTVLQLPVGTRFHPARPALPPASPPPSQKLTPESLSILYVLLVHNEPGLLRRILAALDERQHLFVIHVDLKVRCSLTVCYTILRRRSFLDLLVRLRMCMPWLWMWRGRAPIRTCSCCRRGGSGAPGAASRSSTPHSQVLYWYHRYPFFRAILTYGSHIFPQRCVSASLSDDTTTS